MYNQKFSEKVWVDNGVLSLGGERLSKYEIRGLLGKGANGVVLDALHTVLQQPRAVKVWMKLRNKDRRDKVEQGILEAQKLAAAEPRFVCAIHDAEVRGGYLYSAMERISGISLREDLKAEQDKQTRWFRGYLYFRAIEATTKGDVVHGDPHPGNVMLYKEKFPKYPDGVTFVKLIDFGTSIHRGKADSVKRHWSIVSETFDLLFDGFKHYAEWKDLSLEHSQTSSEESEDPQLAFHRRLLNDVREEAEWDPLSPVPPARRRAS